MLEKVPEDFIPHEVKARLQKYGIFQPMNIFLRQEIDRIQKVLTIVKQTLKDLQLAIDGTIIMSDALKDALDNIFDARVPSTWAKVSWDSSTLGFWFTELLERDSQFKTWIFEARPHVFWLTGFFNPQGFLTAMRQEITRAHKGWALDTVQLFNEMTKMNREDVNSSPSDGVYIYGLSLDGAGWDKRGMRLVEPSPKVLFCMLPVVHMFAVNEMTKEQKAQKVRAVYECPVYKKPQRTDLTYITNIRLKTNQSPDYWTLRGAALLADIKQEIDRIQKVLTIVKQTLKDLQLAIDGTIIMSDALKDALDNIFDARVPSTWAKVSWDSSTLGFWFTELLERDSQFKTWIFEARPHVFWLTGFFNPQGFLTAMRQEITRAHKGWALDTVQLFNEMTKMNREDVNSSPSDGVYIYGLSLDGAGWDKRGMRLVEPSPKVLFCMLPVVHMFAVNEMTKEQKAQKVYECPVYKKPQRTDLTYITN
eukprot:sb/3464300/